MTPLCHSNFQRITRGFPSKSIKVQCTLFSFCAFGQGGRCRVVTVLALHQHSFRASQLSRSTASFSWLFRQLTSHNARRLCKAKAVRCVLHTVHLCGTCTSPAPSRAVLPHASSHYAGTRGKTHSQHSAFFEEQWRAMHVAHSRPVSIFGCNLGGRELLLVGVTRTAA